MDKLESKKKKGETEVIEGCPFCGEEVLEKEVEVLCREGNDGVVVTVKAGVCSHCGERLYPPEAVELFDRVRRKLRERDLRDFANMGTVYRPMEKEH